MLRSKLYCQMFFKLRVVHMKYSAAHRFLWCAAGGRDSLPVGQFETRNLPGSARTETPRTQILSRRPHSQPKRSTDTRPCWGDVIERRGCSPCVVRCWKANHPPGSQQTTGNSTSCAGLTSSLFKRHLYRTGSARTPCGRR